ncbi:hypothetical protein GCM10027613_07980 [Microlunatus endophyticus]
MVGDVEGLHTECPEAEDRIRRDRRRGAGTSDDHLAGPVDRADRLVQGAEVQRTAERGERISPGANRGLEHGCRRRVRGECLGRNEELGRAAGPGNLELEFGEAVESDGACGTDDTRGGDAGAGRDLGGGAGADEQRIGQQQIHDLRLARGEVPAAGLDGPKPSGQQTARIRNVITAVPVHV